MVVQVYSIKDGKGKVTVQYIVEKLNKKEGKVETCLEGYIRPYSK